MAGRVIHWALLIGSLIALVQSDPTWSECVMNFEGGTTNVQIQFYGGRLYFYAPTSRLIFATKDPMVVDPCGNVDLFATSPIQATGCSRPSCSNFVITANGTMYMHASNTSEYHVGVLSDSGSLPWDVWHSYSFADATIRQNSYLVAAGNTAIVFSNNTLPLRLSMGQSATYTGAPAQFQSGTLTAAVASNADPQAIVVVDYDPKVKQLTYAALPTVLEGDWSCLAPVGLDGVITEGPLLASTLASSYPVFVKTDATASMITAGLYGHRNGHQDLPTLPATGAVTGLTGSPFSIHVFDANGNLFSMGFVEPPNITYSPQSPYWAIRGFATPGPPLGTLFAASGKVGGYEILDQVLLVESPQNIYFRVPRTAWGQIVYIAVAPRYCGQVNVTGLCSEQSSAPLQCIALGCCWTGAACSQPASQGRLPLQFGLLSWFQTRLPTSTTSLSRTRSITISPPRTRTHTVMATGSSSRSHTVSRSASQSTSPSSTESRIATRTVTFSSTASRSHLATRTVSFTLSLNSTRSITVSTTRSDSRAATATVTASPNITLSKSISTAATQSATGSRTFTRSGSTTRKPTTTSTCSLSRDREKTRTRTRTRTRTVLPTWAPTAPPTFAPHPPPTHPHPTRAPPPALIGGGGGGIPWDEVNAGVRGGLSGGMLLVALLGLAVVRREMSNIVAVSRGDLGEASASDAAAAAEAEGGAAEEEDVAREPVELSGERYQIRRAIGAGGYGAVFEAKKVTTDEWVAIKYIPMESDIDDTATIDEIDALSSLQGHEHIIRIFTVTFNTSREAARSFDDAERIRRAKLKQPGQLFSRSNCALIITPLYKNGDLRKYVNSYRVAHRNFPEPLAVRYCRQLCEAIHYAHTKNIVHRDIKPENMLLSDDRRSIVLTDFGLCKVMAPDASTLVTSAGSPPYVAPECFQRRYTRKVDNWSIGCVMYAIGAMRVDADNARRMHAMARSADFQEMIHSDLQHYTDEYRRIVLSFLRWRADDRLELPDAIAQLKALEERLERETPSSRMSPKTSTRR
jgi:hypothetical protein